MSAAVQRAIEVCQQERRCLVTGARGFGNRVRFPPAVGTVIWEYQRIETEEET